jgi:ABC-type antimicrobial peptide transport system permease subunit
LSEAKAKRRGRVLFRVFKGFIYGVSIGLVFSVAVYLLASAVRSMAPTVPDPSVISGIIFAGSVVAGVAHEYSEWLEEE